jgi:hypothetical protein
MLVKPHHPLQHTQVCTLLLAFSQDRDQAEVGIPLSIRDLAGHGDYHTSRELFNDSRRRSPQQKRVRLAKQQAIPETLKRCRAV